MNFGANLRRIRKEKNISRERLAVESGVSYPTIAKVELGRDLYITTAEKLAGALGVSLDELCSKSVAA